MLDIIKNIEAAVYVNLVLSFCLRNIETFLEKYECESCIIYGYDTFLLVI